jgi:hypothetical protein
MDGLLGFFSNIVVTAAFTLAGIILAPQILAWWNRLRERRTTERGQKDQKFRLEQKKRYSDELHRLRIYEDDPGRFSAYLSGEILRVLIYVAIAGICLTFALTPPLVFSAFGEANRESIGWQSSIHVVASTLALIFFLKAVLIGREANQDRDDVIDFQRFRVGKERELRDRQGKSLLDNGKKAFATSYKEWLEKEIERLASPMEDPKQTKDQKQEESNSLGEQVSAGPPVP